MHSWQICILSVGSTLCTTPSASSRPRAANNLFDKHDPDTFSRVVYEKIIMKGAASQQFIVYLGGRAQSRIKNSSYTLSGIIQCFLRLVKLIRAKFAARLGLYLFFYKPSHKRK
jgi:hypothetical protein